MEGQTDPTSWSPSSYSRGPTSTIAMDWHLKIKDIEYVVGLSKKSYEFMNSFFRYSRF